MKESNRSHFIQRFKFDFEIDRKEDANRLQNDLSRLFHEKIERLLDQLLTEYDDPAFVTRIPLLQIDLGEIHENSLESEVMRRFELQFRRELSQRMAEIKHPTAVVGPDRGERTMMMPAQLEILAYFLTNGRLPVGAESMAGKVEQLFTELIEAKPQNVLATLKAVIQRFPVALRRLSTAFSERLVERLYGLAANQNSVSISTYELKVSKDVAVAIGKPYGLVQLDVRAIILQYMLVDRPAIFSMQEMEVAVAAKIVAQFGETSAEAFTEQTVAKSKVPKREKKDTTLAQKEAAAIALIGRLIDGKAKEESNTAIIDAWDFLVSNDVQALVRIIAAKASHPNQLSELIVAIPPPALRNFVQRASSTIGLRLLQLAATVISAHDLYSPTAATRDRVVQGVFAAMIHEIAQAPNFAPSPQQALEAIQKHLEALPTPPQDLLASWAQFDFVGPKLSNQTREILEIPEPSPETMTPAQKAEAERKAAEEFQAFIEEERAKGPLSIAEQRRLAEETRRLQEEAKEKEKAWEAEREQRLQAAIDGDSAEGEEIESDEEFFKRGREIQRLAKAAGQVMERIGDIGRMETPESLFATPNLGSSAGRAEMVMYFLATGIAPWWATRFVPMQVEMLLKSLITNDPEAVRIAFETVARGLPASHYPQLVERMAKHLGEGTFTSLLPVLAGDLGGFTVSIGLAMAAAMDDLPAGVEKPSSAEQQRIFAYQHQLTYLMTYASSSPNPAQMLRFVLKQLLPVTQLAPRKLIEWMSQVVERLVEKGERRFMALKSMMPKVFEGIEVVSPTPHPRSADSIAFERALLQSQTDIALEAEAKAAQEAAQTAQEQEQEAQKARQALQEQAAREEAMRNNEVAPDDALPEDPNQPPTEVDASKTVTTDGSLPTDSNLPVDISAEGDPLTAGKETIEGEQEGHEKGPESVPRIEKAEDEENLTPEEREKAESERLRKQLFQQFNSPTPTPETSTEMAPQAPLSLAPEEAENLGIDENWVTAVIKHYLLHGTLSPAATALYSQASFKAEIKTVLAARARPVVQMMREIIGQRDVRMRLYALDEEIAFEAVATLNLAAADKFIPFLREMVALHKGSSSPLATVYIFEHAVLHALSLRTTFLPITYVKELYEFAASQPNVNIREALIWVNRKLETSSSPLRDSLKEMIDVVDRIEDLRESRARNQPAQDDRPVPPPVIPIALDEDIYVSNAGVCIISLFTITLFKAFGFLAEDRKSFVSRQAQVRAIHQIQYMCYKEIDTPEEKMVLAKLMVGWPLQEPLDPLETTFGDEDIDNCEVILGMVCTQWGVMKNAGNEYLRKTFLQRDGRLSQDGTDWRLRVEQNGIDILKNKIPWAVNPIRLPWLDYVVEIEWP